MGGQLKSLFFSSNSFLSISPLAYRSFKTSSADFSCSFVPRDWLVSHLISATMPAIIKTHQRTIKIQPNPPIVPNPKFIILFVELLLPKGDDHPHHIIFIIGIQPPLPTGKAAEVSQPESRLPITIWICSSPSSPCVCIIIAFMAACEFPAIWPIKYSPSTPYCSSLRSAQETSFA